MATSDPGSINDPLADAVEALAKRYGERRERLLQQQVDTRAEREARTSHVDRNVKRTYDQIDGLQLARLDAEHRRELAILAALGQAPEGMNDAQIARDVKEPVQVFAKHTTRREPTAEFQEQAKRPGGISPVGEKIDALAALADAGGNPVLFQRSTEPHPDIKAAKQRAIEQAIGPFDDPGGKGGRGREREGQGRGGYERE
ncbi:hypothetical protein [Rubrivivax rivuli]|uniref:Uncharacterized protein n=1 Tax=Rubrivivax rivuli TaxID=1862385 RepID=A0A437RRI2_9BURK|nr:hypothetical protein [Rubrivivax rivuli]RVU49406.1 hypothetical protein EOE66_02190 [Rubrivivax rivuli]